MPAAKIIRQEIVLLVLIAVAAVPTYLLTLRMANLNRARNNQIAAYWYRQGQRQLTAGRPEEALVSLREATANDHDNRAFAFTLAEALGATNRNDEARLALVRLRESAPESPQINLQLARLAARNHDLPEAIHYYHHALYGLWTGERVDEQRRQVRLELIRLLLDQKARSRALAELLVLSSDAPRTADTQLELGQLFLEAGNASNALQHFAQANLLDGRNVAALSGAGEAAFQLGDYRTAERYLAQAVELDKSAGRAAQTLEAARLIQSSDPLAAHLPRTERVRRLSAALVQSMRRLEQCPGVVQEGVVPDTLHLQVEALLPRITPENLREDPELLAEGAELVLRIEETTNKTCGPAQGIDQALLLAGRKHRASER